MGKQRESNGIKPIRSLAQELGFSLGAYTTVVPILDSTNLRRTVVAKALHSYLKPEYSDFNFKQEWNKNGFKSAMGLMRDSARRNPLTYLELGVSLARVYIIVACDLLSSQRGARPKSNPLSVMLKVLLLPPITIVNALFKVLAQPKRIYAAAKNTFSPVKDFAVRQLVRLSKWFKTKVMGSKAVTAITDTVTVRRKRKSSSYSDVLHLQKKRRQSISMDDRQSMASSSSEFERTQGSDSSLYLGELGVFGQIPEKYEQGDSVEMTLNPVKNL